MQRQFDVIIERDRQARIVLHTLGLAGMGIILGISACWILAPAIKGLLFGVTSTDPATLLGMIVTLAVLAAIDRLFAGSPCVAD